MLKRVAWGVFLEMVVTCNKSRATRVSYRLETCAAPSSVAVIIVFRIPPTPDGVDHPFLSKLILTTPLNHCATGSCEWKLAFY